MTNHIRNRNYAVPNEPRDPDIVDDVPAPEAGMAVYEGGPSSIARGRRMTVEEMEVDARRLYIGGRLNEESKAAAVAILMQHHPALEASRLMRLITAWDRNVTEIERQADASWSRRQMVNLFLRCQLRQSQFDNAFQGAQDTDEKVKALNSARLEDIYQISLVDRIVGLKSEIEEGADEAAEAAARPTHIEELKLMTRRLLPDGEMQEKMATMRRAAYGGETPSTT